MYSFNSGAHSRSPGGLINGNDYIINTSINSRESLVYTHRKISRLNSTIVQISCSCNFDFSLAKMVSAKLLLILLTATTATEASWGGPTKPSFTLPTIKLPPLPRQNVFKNDGTYILLGNNGQYLSRVRRGIIDFIEAEKVSIDVFCLFRATLRANGKVAFKADNGNANYLSRYTFSHGVSNIVAVKKTIDVFSEFEVEVSTPGPYDGVRYVHLKADNGKYWGIVNSNGRNNIEAIFNKKSDDTRLVVLEAQ